MSAILSYHAHGLRPPTAAEGAKVEGWVLLLDRTPGHSRLGGRAEEFPEIDELIAAVFFG
jgi:hypothetical protein